MAEEAIDTDLSMWFSTYGLLTSQRILERLHIHLVSAELIAAVKNPRSVYYQLLRVPLKNVFNGIILQQAHDYQVYAQKLFIDYLLSGEGSKEEVAPGANTRDDLEAERTRLIEMSEAFHKQEIAHQTLISESQAHLIQVAAELQKSLQLVAKQMSQLLQKQQIIKEDKLIQQALRTAIIHYEKIDNEVLAISSTFWKEISSILNAELNNEIRQQLAGVISTIGDPRHEIETILSTYLEQADDMGISLRSYRSQFYDVILRATEFIQLLPDYRVDKEKEAEDRSSLYFDAHIGES